jgi:hypothetical protein
MTDYPTTLTEKLLNFQMRLPWGLAQTGMRQNEIVIHLEEHQLLTQSVLALTWRGAASPHRRYPLPQTQIETVTVDGQIALSTSASKPRVRVSTHEAPQ